MGTYNRNGATLVLVIVVVATLISICLSASSIAASRYKLAARLHAEAKLREKAISVLNETLKELAQSTNVVRTLNDSWHANSLTSIDALESGANGIFVVIDDERSRLPFHRLTDKALGYYISDQTGMNLRIAVGKAQAIMQWWEQLKHISTNYVLHSEVELTESTSDLAITRVLRRLSIMEDAKININTVERSELIAMAIGCGASEAGALGLWLRLKMARDRGDVFTSTDAYQALKLLKGSGDNPSEEEKNALRVIQEHICVGGGPFRINVYAKSHDARINIQELFVPEKKQILLHAE